MADEGEESVLRIGDYVYLKNPRHDAILSAVGYLDDKLYLDSEIDAYEDSLFQICHQFQYSAAKEYKDFLDRENISEKDLQALEDDNEGDIFLPDDQFEKLQLLKSNLGYINALENGKSKEQDLNDKYMKNKIETGEPVKFGDTIQLLHVSSGKFITSSPAVTAEVEKENLRIYLSEGDQNSWLQIKPRYKIDKEGFDFVRNFSEVYLRIAEKAAEYIRASDRYHPGSITKREINCSLEKSTWKFTFFNSNEMNNLESLRVGDVICLHDPETRSYLSLPIPKIEHLDKDLLNEGDPVIDEEENESLLHDAFLNDEINPADIDSNVLFIIEGDEFMDGGTLQYKKNYRLRHLNSGRYLTAKAQTSVNRSRLLIKTLTVGLKATKDVDKITHIFTSEKERSSNGVFSFHSVGENRGRSAQKIKDVTDKAAVLLEKDGRWMKKGPLHPDSNLPVCEAVNTREKAMGLLINRIPRHYVQQSLLGKAALSIMSSFVDHFAHLDIKVLDEKVKFYEDVMENLKENIIDADSSATEQQKADLQPEQSLKTRQQRFLMEQGILTIIIDLFSITRKFEKNMKGMDESKLGALSKIIQTIRKSSFELFYHCVKGNAKNQIFAADRFPVLLSNVSSEPLATSCIVEMLTTNLELQEQKVGDREIGIFVRMIRGAKMNATYVNLLMATCSCMGRGIDGNQTAVASTLFEDNRDILIAVLADDKQLKPCSWKSSNLYSGGLDEALGKDLRKNGIPELMVSWMSEDPAISCQNLFGDDKVNLYDVAEVLEVELVKNAMKNAGTQAAEAHLEYEMSKYRIAEFLIAQLDLCAETCLDRNYISMSFCEEIFTFDILMVIIRDGKIPADMRASAVRLMTCLYVDRNPQKRIPIPRLSRCWTELIQDDPENFAKPADNEWRFMLLQEFINGYMQELTTSNWSSLTLRTVELTLKLLQFHFYVSGPQIQGAVGLILTCLDKAQEAKLEEEQKKTMRKQVKVQKKYSLEDDGEDDDDGESKLVEVGKTTLKFADSIGWIIFILLLVIVAITVQLIETITTPDELIGYIIWEWIVFSIFLVELTVRMFFFFIVNHNIRDFFKDKMACMDVFVVLLDIAIIGLSVAFNNIDSIGKYGKGLRIVRLVRLVRIVKAGSRLAALRDRYNNKIFKKWKLPERYSLISRTNLNTMVSMVDVLLDVLKITEDYYLSEYLNQVACCKDEEEIQITDLFEDVLKSGTVLDIDANGNLDDIFLDLLMYESSDLVQSCLSVLMFHHSKRKYLLDDIKRCQIIAGEEDEFFFNELKEKLKELSRLAETHELWGNIEKESDISQNNSMKVILDELTEACKAKNSCLNLDEPCMPNVEIQDTLRNLGAFDICLSILMLDANDDSDASTNTRDIKTRCSKVLVWFLKGNEENQQLGFDVLKYLISLIDDGINISFVIAEVFRNNSLLQKQFSENMILDITDKIIKKGHQAHYLYILESITNTGEKNNIDNQYNILKYITVPSRLPHIMYLCQDPTSPEYAERKKFMIAVQNHTGDNVDDEINNMKDQLDYHYSLLRMLANCTIGRASVTTLEAKLQSLYDYEYILYALLDKDSSEELKYCLARFFYFACIEVSIKDVKKMMRCQGLWLYFDSLTKQFSIVRDALQSLNERSKAREVGNPAFITKMNYFYYNLLILIGFFKEFFDAEELFSDQGEQNGAPNIADKGIVEYGTEVSLDKSNIYRMVYSMYTTIGEIYDMHCTIFTMEQEEVMYELIGLFENLAPEGGFHIVNRKSPKNKDSNAIEMNETQEYFSEKKEELDADEDLQDQISKDRVGLIDKLAELPKEGDNCESDIRKEPLIRKLVKHTLKKTKRYLHKKVLDPECTKTTQWVIELFRGMIEKEWGMTIDERDEEGGEEQDIAAEETQNILDDCGVTELCLGLIAVGIDENLILECVKLLVALLFREGGNGKVQETIYNYLSSNDTTLFFLYIKEAIAKLIAYHQYNPEAQREIEEDDEPELPEHIILIKILQLMCEGHYHPNQEIIRTQPNNKTQINLLEILSVYLAQSSKRPCRISTAASTTVAETCLEVLQGPCVENQKYFATSTEILETMNRMLRAKCIGDEDEDEEDDLKELVIAIFKGLVEGAPNKGSQVFDRIISTIHFDILQQLVAPPSIYASLDDEEEEIELTQLQIASLVLLKMLCNYDPSQEDKITVPAKVEEKFDKSVTSVEIVWNGVLQKRFFHVPDMVYDLSANSKDKLVEEVNRENQELKLQDFLFRSKDLYREIQHQQWLKSIQLCAGLNCSLLFSRSNQNSATWFAFSLACLINLLMVSFYKRENQDVDEVPSMGEKVNGIVSFLNSFNTIFSAFTLFLFIFVRSPVKYRSLIEPPSSKSKYYALFFVIFDLQTLYYFFYVIFSLMANIHSPLWAPFLLLDIIIKDSTTRDVLNAIIYPIKQLSMTVILGVFVMYIFSAFTFFIFPYEFQEGFTDYCATLAQCLVVHIDYGMRMGGGVGDIQSHTLEKRMWVDYLFFVIVLVILLNIIFGIIIDTFSELRSKKQERLADTTDLCFICGIDKHTFDRAADSPQLGFKFHIKQEHNMWAYLFFIIYLWEQDKDDDDGLEQYVRQLVESDDITWFPMEKAITLDNHSEDVEDIQDTIQNISDSFNINLSKQADAIIKTQEKSSNNVKLQLQDINYQTTEFHKQYAKKFNQVFRAIDVLRSVIRSNEIPGIDTASSSKASEGDKSSSTNAFGEDKKKRRRDLAKDKYDDQTGPAVSRIMKMQIEEAQGLVQPFLFGTADPFIVAHIFENNTFIAQTEIIWMTTDPVWTNASPNTFIINLKDAKLDEVRVELHHVHRRGKGNFLGEIELKWHDCLSKDMVGDKAFHKLQKKESQPRTFNKYVQGDIGLRLWIKDIN